MRVSLIISVLLLSAEIVFGYTFVLKTGKRIEGTFVFEDESTIRVKDRAGLSMTLKKSLLDVERMKEVNVNEKQAVSEPVVVKARNLYGGLESLAEIARESVRNRTGKCRVVTEEDLRKAPPLSIVLASSRSVPLKGTSLQELTLRLKMAQQNYNRLKAECRSAGIHALPLGRYADPDEIENAKEMCSKAIAAESELAQARMNLQAFTQQTQ